MDLTLSLPLAPLTRYPGVGEELRHARKDQEAQEREIAQKVARLKEIDRKVRAHEAAHMAAGAGLVVQGAQYHMVRGPDGNLYAVGGEVRIDVSPGRTPEETLRKAEQIRAAALAPADPSPQDLKVAAQAAQMALQAQMELAQQRLAARAHPHAFSATAPSDGNSAHLEGRSWRANQAVAAYLRQAMA